MTGSPDVSAATLAHHALAALPRFDADRAVALAVRAGEGALAHHAYEEAVMWLSRALDAAPATTSPQWRAGVLVMVGEANRHMSALSAARRAFVEAADLTDDAAILARAALGYADPGADLGIAYRSGDLTTAALLDQALCAQPSIDTVISIQLESRLAAELYFSDEPERSRHHAMAALQRARRLGDPRALGRATAVVHDAFVIGQAPMAEQLADSAGLLALARTHGSTGGLLTAHRARVLDLLSSGDLTAMDAEIVAFRRLAEPRVVVEFQGAATYAKH